MSLFNYRCVTTITKSHQHPGGHHHHHPHLHHHHHGHHHGIVTWESRLSCCEGLPAKTSAQGTTGLPLAHRPAKYICISLAHFVCIFSFCVAYFCIFVFGTWDDRFAISSPSCKIIIVFLFHSLSVFLVFALLFLYFCICMGRPVCHFCTVCLYF